MRSRRPVHGAHGNRHDPLDSAYGLPLRLRRQLLGLCQARANGERPQPAAMGTGSLSLLEQRERFAGDWSHGTSPRNMHTLGHPSPRPRGVSSVARVGRRSDPFVWLVRCVD